MVGELLLALAGFSGRLIKATEGRFQVTWEGSEKALLEEVVSVGYDCSVVRDFVEEVQRLADLDTDTNRCCNNEKTSSSSSTKNNTNSMIRGGEKDRMSPKDANKNVDALGTSLSSYEVEPLFSVAAKERCEVQGGGLYVVCVSHELEGFVLAYLNKICEIERQVMQGVMKLPLGEVLHQLADYRVVFHILKDVVIQSRERLRLGGPRVSLVSPVAPVSSLASVFQSASSSPSFPRWLVECLCAGTLSGDTLACATYRILLRGAGGALLHLVAQWMSYGHLTDEEFFIRGDGKPRPSCNTIDDEEPSSDTTRQESSFRVDWCLVPESLISCATASKVLFVGTAVRTLTRNGQWGSAEVRGLAPALKHLKGAFDAPVNPRRIIDKCIEAIRAKVANLLWRLLVEDAGLIKHLQTLRDFLFMQNGELYCALLEAAWPLLCTPVTKRADMFFKTTIWASAITSIEDTDKQGASNAQLFSPMLCSSGFRVSRFSADSASLVSCSGRYSVLTDGVVRLGCPPPGNNNLPTTTASSVRGYCHLWYSHKCFVAYGFRHHFALSLNARQGPTTASKWTNYWGARWAVVFQSKRAPPKFREVEFTKGIWTSIGDCAAIEFRAAVRPKYNKESNRKASSSVVFLTAELLTGSGPTGQVVGLARGKQSWTQTGDDTEQLQIDIIYRHGESELTITLNSEGRDLGTLLDFKPIEFSRCVTLDLGTAHIGLVTLPLAHTHTMAGDLEEERAKPMFTQHDRSLDVGCWSHEGVRPPNSLPTTDGTKIAKEETENRGAERSSGATEQWTDLRLVHTPHWPLPLIITDENITTYNAVFQLLFRIRKAHFGLQHMCRPRRTLRQGRHGSPGATTMQPPRRLSLLRNQINFVLNQVLYHLHADVLEVRFAALLESIAGYKDFEKVKAAHDLFLQDIVMKCFLRVPSVISPLLGILSCATDVTKVSADLDLRRTAANCVEHVDEDLTDIRRRLDSHLIQLHGELAAVAQSVNHAEAAHLALRLDFNRYISRTPPTPRDGSLPPTPRSCVSPFLSPCIQSLSGITPQLTSWSTPTDAGIAGNKTPTRTSRTEPRGLALRGDPPTLRTESVVIPADILGAASHAQDSEGQIFLETDNSAMTKLDALEVNVGVPKAFLSQFTTYHKNILPSFKSTSPESSSISGAVLMSPFELPRPPPVCHLQSTSGRSATSTSAAGTLERSFAAFSLDLPPLPSERVPTPEADTCPPGGTWETSHPLTTDVLTPTSTVRPDVPLSAQYMQTAARLRQLVERSTGASHAR